MRYEQNITLVNGILVGCLEEYYSCATVIGYIVRIYKAPGIQECPDPIIDSRARTWCPRRYYRSINEWDFTMIPSNMTLLFVQSYGNINTATDRLLNLLEFPAMTLLQYD